jgi:hypothetical protein
MKYLITLTMLMISLSAGSVLAQADVFGPRDIDFKLGELASLPVGIKVTHTPGTVMPSFTGPSGRDWLHATTVTATGGPVNIVEYGYFVERDGHWGHAYGLDQAFTEREFAETFTCPEARLQPGESYTFEWNRSLMDGRAEQRGLWYFIGVDVDGRRVKGEATLILQNNSGELCFNLIER